MKLLDFLKRYGITYTGAARIIDVSPQHLRRIAAGDVKPTRRLARDICAYTDGAVTMDDLTPANDDQQLAI